MKLEYVEMAGFRGFRDRIRFDFPAGFVVLTGHNGAGKSTVLDAIDFALTGEINKFSVKTARGGGPEQYLWWVGSDRPESYFVTVGFVNESGERLAITRTRDRVENIDKLASLLSAEIGADSDLLKTLVDTSLIRDELIMKLSLDLPEQQRFAAVRDAIGGLLGPDHSVRTGQIVKAATAARDNQKLRLDSARDGLGRALQELTAARSAAERSTGIPEALATVGSYLPSTMTDPRERQEAVRTLIVEERVALKELDDTVPEAERLLGLRRELEKSSSEVKHLDDTEVTLIALRDVAKNAFEHASLVDEAVRQADIISSHFSALLEHGTALGLQKDHCPLCDAYRSQEEFDAAVKATRDRLAERGQLLERSAAALAAAKLKFEAAELQLKDARAKIADFNDQHAAINNALNEIQAIYVRHRLEAPKDNPEAAKLEILRRRENLTKLERALIVLEASSLVDRVSSIEARITKLREQLAEETARLFIADRAAETAKQIDSSAKTVANQLLSEQFDTVMPLLKELYSRLRPHTDWREIESDFGGKVRASLNFTVGDGHNVQFLFSSGQRRAAGLAFLLAIHLSRRWCKLRSLLLDDPVQHIDDYRALNLVEILSAIRRTGRQVIIAVEDSALADLLCRRLRSTASEMGRRFDLHASVNGSSAIESVRDVFPMPHAVLEAREAS